MRNKVILLSIIFWGLYLIGCTNTTTRNSNSDLGVSNYTQTFEEGGFSISTPCKLEDVSANSNGDFLINYGGVENPDDNEKITAYQVMVSKVPVENNNISTSEYDKFIDESLSYITSSLTNVEKTNFGDDLYPGYIGYSTSNGLKQKGVIFYKEPYVITLTLMTNNNLEEKFDKFINSFKKINVDNIKNVSEVSAETKNSSLPNKYKHKNFSFDYPTTWEIVQENSKATAKTTIAVQVMEQNVSSEDFAPNINVIISNDKHSEPTSQLAQISYNMVRDSGLQSKFYQIKDVKIGDYNGSLADYSVNINGYELRILQYIVKKFDNTTITITITLDNNKYISQKQIGNEIIESFKIY